MPATPPARRTRALPTPTLRLPTLMLRPPTPMLPPRMRMPRLPTRVMPLQARAATTGVTYQMGAVYGALPAGCISPHVSSGGTYYLCGNTWFSPSYGANGVLYKVVPTP